MSAAASMPVYFAMTGAAAPGGGVEAGFIWSFRAGRELTGDRREVGADPGQADSAPGQRVNRPVVALCRNADHRNQVITVHRDGGYRRRGRFLIQRRTAVTSPILPDYVPVSRASLGPAVTGRGNYVGGVERNLYWVTDGDCHPAFLTTRERVRASRHDCYV